MTTEEKEEVTSANMDRIERLYSYDGKSSPKQLTDS